MKLRLLTGDDVRRCLTMPRAIDLMADAFAALSGSQVDAPLRTTITSANGTMLYKPALLQSAGIFVVKAVSVFPSNVARQLPVTTGLLLVNDAFTGLPLALMDAEYLTALRTGAASGLACRLLANPNVKRAALFGAGGQARCQLEALLCTNPLHVIYVFSRRPESAETLCREYANSSPISPKSGGEHDAVDEEKEIQDPTSAKSGYSCSTSTGQCRLVPNPDRSVLMTCGVISTATTSPTPVFADHEIAPGTHICGVGSFTPATAEVPAETVCRAVVFVDQRAACLGEAGDLRQPMDRGLLSADFHPAELGEVVLGTAAGRPSRDALTFFKSVGNAAQDVVCAAEVLRRAESEGIGSMIVV